MCSLTVAALSIYDDEALLKDILKPFTYTTPKVRNAVEHQLLKLLGSWIEVPDEKMPLLDDLVFYMYNCSLVIDDIYDNALLRRGKPAAHKVFGTIRTIMSINLTLVTMMDVIEKLGDKETLKKIITRSPEMLGGEGLELYWRDKNICPTEEELLNMTYFKCAVPSMLIAEVVSIFGTRQFNRYENLMKAFGMFYQFNNDYQNLCSKECQVQKGFCEDLTEGKFSLSVVHAINNFPKEGKIIQGILKERTFDVEKKKYCLSLLKKCGSLSYTAKVLEDFKKVIFEEIQKIDDDPMLKQFLETAVISYL